MVHTHHLDIANSPNHIQPLLDIHPVPQHMNHPDNELVLLLHMLFAMDNHWHCHDMNHLDTCTVMQSHMMVQQHK